MCPIEAPVWRRYRANLALGLAERSKDPRQPFVVDEWTSELDRDLARVISVAFSKRMSPGHLANEMWLRCRG